jgi:hypothetical protein
MAALLVLQCIAALLKINGHRVSISIYHNAVSMQTGYLYWLAALGACTTYFARDKLCSAFYSLPLV